MADDIKPWTIKGIPPEARNAAIAAAEREKMNVGQWIERAILTAIKADRPGALVRQGNDLAEIERLVAMSAQLAAASGAAPPKGVTRLAYKLLKDRLADIKGPGPTNPRLGQTKTVLSPTEGDESPT